MSNRRQLTTTWGTISNLVIPPARDWGGFALPSSPATSAAWATSTRTLDRAVAAWHRRPLRDQYRYLFFDGLSLRVKTPTAPSAAPSSSPTA